MKRSTSEMPYACIEQMTNAERRACDSSFEIEDILSRIRLGKPLESWRIPNHWRDFSLYRFIVRAPADGEVGVYYLRGEAVDRCIGSLKFFCHQQGENVPEDAKEALLLGRHVRLKREGKTIVDGWVEEKPLADFITHPFESR